jgi:predicted nucleic acid-binding protein
MATNNILLDTNIIMELFFERTKQKTVIEAVNNLPKNKDIVITITILSLSTLLYFVEKEKIDKSIVHAFLDGYKVLDINNDDYKWARGNDEGDFEDALQTACALRHHCNKILTLDTEFESMYGKYISVITIK